MGTISLPITARLNAILGTVGVFIDAALFTCGQAITPLPLRAGFMLAKGTVTASIQVRFYIKSSAIALQINAQVAKKPIYGDLDITYHWAPQVWVNGALVQTTGEISVYGEEASAMQASFSLAAPPNFKINQPVVVSVTISEFTSTLFTGTITEIQFNPHQGVSTILASDGLQNYFDIKTRKFIEGITSTLFPTLNNTQEGYDYFKHCLEYQLFNVHLNAYGALVRSGIFGGTPYPTPILTAIDGSEVLSLVRADQVINKIPLAFDVSWVRIFKVETRMEWQTPWTVCQTFGVNMRYLPTLPSAGSVKPMIDGLGWKVDSYFETLIRPSNGQVVYCPSPTGPRPLIALADNTGLGQIKFGLSRRASRTFHWQFPVLITADTIGIFGDRPQKMAGSYTAPLTDEDWLKDEGTLPDSVLDKRDPDNIKIHDQLDFDHDFIPRLKVELARYTRIIVESHRQTRATITTPILPDLTREHSVTIDTPSFSATGKVTRIQHKLDTDAGSATTQITIGIIEGNSAGFSAKFTIDAFLPDKKRTLTQKIEPTEFLPTWIGGTVTSPPEPLSPTGWVINANPPSYGASLYQTTGFIVKTPDISLPDQAQVEGVNQCSFNITLPKSTLVYK